MTSPRRSYLVCATPRSGSTLLCETLIQTGVAGRPREYFEALPDSGLPRQPREYLADLAQTDAAVDALLPPLRRGRPLPPFEQRLAAALEEGTTGNGVFGAKLMWGYAQPFVDAVGDAPGHVLPGLRYVLVTRRDRVRQAMSLWRALQTQVWSRQGDGNGEPARRRRPVYCAAAIDALQAQLDEHEDAWRQWFAARGIAPLELVYEEFAECPAAAVAAVLEHLGIPPPAGFAPRPPLRRQADELTEEWVRRHERAPAR